jgi:hypothetical protein
VQRLGSVEPVAFAHAQTGEGLWQENQIGIVPQCLLQQLQGVIPVRLTAALSVKVDTA